MPRFIPFLLVALIITIALPAPAQDSDTIRFASGVDISGKPFHAKVRLIDNRKLKGILKSIGPYSIKLERSKGPSNDLTSDSSAIREIQYTDIMDIKVKGNTGEIMGGILVGAMVGAAGGGLLGLAIPCTECETEDEINQILIFAGIGALILGPVGAIDSPFIVHVTVDGEYSNFEEFKYRMNKKMQKRLESQRE